MRGVVLLAFGHPIYGALSYQMALSIKYFADIPVHLVYEERALSALQERHLKYFDSKQEINREDLYDGDKFNPGKAKVSIYKYLPFEHNIYLDSDGCALKDLTPLFDTLIDKKGYYYTHVIGYHTIDKGREFKESIWAWADDLWEHYKLKNTDVMPATNSSFSFIRKCKESEKFFSRLRKNYVDNPLPIEKLRYKWGGTYPDELALNVTLAQFNLDPSPGFHPMLLSMTRIDAAEAIKNYYLLSWFGGNNFSHSTVIGLYDRLIHTYSVEKENRNIEFKAHLIVKNKHANKR